jgi:hypothetical protein
MIKDELIVFSEYINTFSTKVFNSQPPFELTGDFVSTECRKASEEFVLSLHKFELWALKSELDKHKSDGLEM